MQLGINLLNFGPATDPGVLRGWSELADDAGYDILTVADHVTITPDVAAFYPETFYDPFATIAWLTGVNQRVHLATSVLIVPYRHPLLVARLAANVHEFSGGRFSLGIGVGWSEQEFAALGVSHARRGELTDAAMAQIRREWASYGRGAESIPLWVGGHSAAALARAKRLGALWHPLGLTLAQMRTLVARHELAAFVPRIRLSLTHEPVPEDQRKPGTGTVGQVVSDIDALKTLGARAVILDPYGRRPAELDDPAASWEALRAVGRSWQERQ